MMLLLFLYPYTGLGRIVSIPLTLIFNLVLSLAGCYLFNLIRIRRRLLIIISILVSLIITLWFYPQDGPPHVVILIMEDIKNIFEK